MKNLLGTLAVILSLTSLYSTNAHAFSSPPRSYSQEALKLLIESQDVINAIPIGNAITSIEKVGVGGKAYRFEVKAGECTVTVEFDTTTPKGFIGNGFPHSPKVVDTDGCN